MKMVCDDVYIERDNLSAFMVYDMAICVSDAGNDNDLFVDCPLIGGNYSDGLIVDDADKHARPNVVTGNKWVTVIDEANQIRVDNVVDTWIRLTEGLQPGEKLVVSQSYHLMVWDDSGQPMITNWAQGDTMEFDVELDARQLTAPTPGVGVDGKAAALLVQKDTSTWDPISGGASGVLTYVAANETFDYEFNATGLLNQDYQLIYYPDPWASSKQVVLIGNSFNGTTATMPVAGNVELNMDLPNSIAGYDNNYPVGAKVWLVPTSSLSGNTLLWTNIDEFLFDFTLVNYDDSSI